ncbi:MAG: M67 family metallopeptidase [Chloroflexi bacterium]|nr:M67 family metallopeptidase [Chloroflexota bacterium]
MRDINCLYLTEALARDLIRHAQDAAPLEACGILLGASGQVREVVPVRNAAADPQHFYRLDERQFVTAVFEAEKRGLSLLSLYHSHPGGEPIPSPADVAQAAYPDTPYLIIGLKNQMPRLAAWAIRYGQVSPVELVIGQLEALTDTVRPSFTRTHQAAILLSGLLAFIIMLILSLSLLPPAPVILTPLP